jgi:hsp70-interacting protein
MPMSPEDRAFLETVMKEGIIDENRRMKTILHDVTGQMEAWKTAPYTPEEANAVEALLQELRDIVEQIDYARAFAAMKGLNFVLGCVQERDAMPRSTRVVCLGLIATLCQHNPPVQKELLELGSVGILSDLFFQINAQEDDPNGDLRATIVQAMSANVRSHELAEAVFCQLEQAPQLLSLGVDKEAPDALRRRSIFFLRALLTSDASTQERVRRFAPCIVSAIDNILLTAHARDDSAFQSSEVVEMALSLVQQVLEQKRSLNAILARKDPLASMGVQRIAAIRQLSGEDSASAEVELGLWENILRLLARATPNNEEIGSGLMAQ